MNLEKQLTQGIAQLGLTLNDAASKKLLHYLELLQKWNKVYNLTAIRLPEQMVTYHLLDSLAVLPYLEAGHWLDVGCGAGLPGLVLAIAQPEWRFTLLDSNSKKTSFVQQAIIDLQLDNVTVCCARVENWQIDEKFDGIISRAFANVADFIAVSRHLLAEKGCWAAMKGEPAQELAQLPGDIEVERIISLNVPGLEGARCLVILRTK